MQEQLGDPFITIKKQNPVGPILLLCNLDYLQITYICGQMFPCSQHVLNLNVKPCF